MSKIIKRKAGAASRCSAWLNRAATRQEPSCVLTAVAWWIRRERMTVNLHNEFPYDKVLASARQM